MLSSIFENLRKFIFATLQSSDKKQLRGCAMIVLLCTVGSLLAGVSSAPSWYDGCFYYITTMNCSKQSLTELPEITESVNNIDLSYNLIFEINSDDNLKNIETLDLSHNRIRVFDLNLNETELKTLKLAGNPLKQVSLSSATLKTLDISWCDISHLQSGFLSRLPALETLDISHNPLKLIHPLDGGKLRQLYIQGCLFRKIDFNLPELDLLDVSYNRYMTVLKLESNLTKLKASHGQFFQADLALPNLKVLDISYNKLSQVYLNNPSLEVLDISWNSLRSLDLIDVAYLIKIDLSHNLLHELELTIDTLLYLNVSFNPLVKLHIYSNRMEYIDCTACQLKYIDLPDVHTLNVSRNGLEMFKGNNEIMYLDLSHNLLDTYTGNAKLIDLRGNRFSLPKRVILTGTALMDNNPWLCKCDDISLQELFLKAIDHVHCASPEGKTFDSCFNTKLPKYVKDSPWIPLAASGILTIIIVIGMYVVKRRIWLQRPDTPQSSSSEQQQQQQNGADEEGEPIRVRYEDRLPSYEEALLMNKPNYNVRRSYEFPANRRPSSSSI